MAYVPPNKRYSRGPERHSLTPDLLRPQHKRRFNQGSSKNNNVDRSGKIIYDDKAIRRWCDVGFDEDDQVPSSFNLEPAEEHLALVNTKPAKENGEGSDNTSSRPWETMAENVWPDLLSSYDIVRNKMESEDVEELKPTLVARFGNILFIESPPWGLEGVRKSDVSQLRRSFDTNIPSSYMENIVSEVVPKIGFSFIDEKEVFLVKFSYSRRPDSTICCKCMMKEDKTLEIYKVELHQVRQMVVDVSCVNKDLDLRLMLLTKKILTALTDDEMNSMRNLINLAVLDPEVKGGLKWAYGKSHSKEGFRVIGVWHTTTKWYITPLLKLKVRHADRYDFKTATGAATMEVVLKLKKIASDLQEEKVEKDSILDVFKANLRMIEEMKEVGINGRLSALIVDDDPVIRILHTAILKSFGLITQIAKNGKEAIDLFNSGAKFDVVFVDRDMPIMNGIEATKQLRAMGVTCRIVGVTSRGNDAEEEVFVQAGLDLFHEKPLTAAKIRPFIMQLQE